MTEANLSMVMKFRDKDGAYVSFQHISHNRDLLQRQLDVLILRRTRVITRTKHSKHAT